MEIINSLVVSGAVTVKQILDTGKTTEAELLLAFHREGVLDSPKLLLETVKAISESINGDDLTNLELAEKTAECSTVYKTVSEMYYELAEEEADADIPVVSHETIVV